ncbi:MAG: hypothetical protein IJT44_08020 [Clostridia bacterium]|nr:hypothetical protein [Clostridia bacterium]
MDHKAKRFNVLVIMLTLCLAAALIFVAVAKFKPQSAVSPAAEAFSFRDLRDGYSEPLPEETPEFLTDAVWEDMRFILSGVEYRLPLDVSELEAHGWTGFSEKTVMPDEKVSFEAFYGDAAIAGDLYNPSSTEKSARECQVVRICFTWANGILPQDVRIMKTGIDEVIEKYGEPLFEDQDARAVTYETIDYDGGFAALIDENKPGVKVFYDEKGTIVYAELYCGNIGEEAE